MRAEGRETAHNRNTISEASSPSSRETSASYDDNNVPDLTMFRGLCFGCEVEATFE